VTQPFDPVEQLSSCRSGTDLCDRRRSLEDRLDDGYRRIDQAMLSGSDVTDWESFWLRLLDEYEDVCRELDQAA
jgi:hypothetical protein